MNPYSDKSIHWSIYLGGALFMVATTFWAVSKSREEISIRYDMSIPIRTEPLPERGGLPAAAGGALSRAVEAPGPAAARVQGAPPPDIITGGGLPTESLPSAGRVFSEEAGAATAVHASASEMGAAGEGGGSSASGAGPSGKEFLATVDSTGTNPPAALGGRKGAMLGKAAASRSASKGGSRSIMRAGSAPSTDPFRMTDQQVQALSKAVESEDAGKGDWGNLSRMTDQQVKAIGKVAQRQIQKLQKAHAAEEKLHSDIIEAANSTPFQPPPADARPIQRGTVWPVKGGGRVSQEFGPSDWAIYAGFNYKGRYYPHFHRGMDIAAPLGTPLLAFDAGKTIYAGGNQASGVMVILQHPDGLSTSYRHMGLGRAGPTVRVGEYVSAGQVLGYVGMTGRTTGPHVHFAATKGSATINPREVLLKK